MWGTLDNTYSESWRKTINCHDSPSYYTTWTLNFERILSCAKINRRLWPIGETLKWSYIHMDWVTIDGSWWQHVFSMKAPWYLMKLRQYVPLGDPIQNKKWVLLKFHLNNDRKSDREHPKGRWMSDLKI